MFTSNPFAALSAVISPAVMQTYIVVMIILVAGGTLFDIYHKKSARYFFENWRKTKSKGAEPLGTGQMICLTVRTVAEAMVSGEFCNPRRRIAHLLTMYGFVIYAATTFILVFFYPTPAAPAPAIVSQLWYIGALMVCLGGYWFWFFIRVDVLAEGHCPLRVVRADLFILSLLASVTLGLIWAWAQAAGCSWTNIALGAYLIATTVLFGSVPWSKFSHMFYKPAAALQKKIEEANGTRRNLPAPADKPEVFGSTRQQPRHY